MSKFVPIGLIGCFVAACVSAPASAQAEPSVGGLTLTEASSLAAASGSRVQVGSLDSESSTTWANPEGSFTVDQTSEPTRLRTTDGLVPIDPELVSNGAGSLIPKAATVDATIGAGGDARLFTVALGSGTVTYSWPTTLPAAVVDGNTVTYPDVSPGVDLTLTVTNLEVETTLVVATPAAAMQVQTVRVLEDLDGLRQRNDAAGNSNFVDTAGTVVGTSSAPRAWEASSTSAEPDAVALNRDLFGDGNTPVVDGQLATPAAEVITTPTSFLSSPATTYPVTIDPQINPAMVAFAYTDSAHATQTYVNDGWDSNRVHVGLDPYNTSSLNRAYFHFQGQAVATQGQVSIEHAELNTTLEYTSYPTPTKTNLFSTPGWGAGMNWNSRPDADPNAVSFIAQSDAFQAHYTAPVPVGFDIANYIGTHLGATDHYFSLQATAENDYTHWKKFRSAATMSVTYNVTAGSPTNFRYVTPHLTCDNGDGMPMVNKSYLAGGVMTVTVNATDPNGGQPYVHFYLQKLSGTQWVLATQADTGRQASGTDFTWNIPASAIPADSVIRFGAQTVTGPDAAHLTPGGSGIACKVGIDSTAPKVPLTSAASVSAVLGQPVSPALTVSPHSATEDDIRCYVYSLSATKPSLDSPSLEGCRHTGSSGELMFANNDYSVVHTSSSGTATLDLAPRASSGTLSIWGIDGALNLSATPATVTITGQTDTTLAGKQHTWNTDAASPGATTVADTTTATNPKALSVPTGSSLVAGAAPFAPATGAVLRMNSGTARGVAATSGLVTTGSARLSLGAWAKPAALDNVDHVLLRQSAGTDASAQLVLGKDGRWYGCIFATGRDTRIRPTCAVSAQPAAAGQWRYVSMVYDKTNRQIWLRVNDATGGQDEGAAYLPPDDVAIAADGPLTIGTSTAYWIGDIARPYIVAGVLSEAQFDNISRARAIDDDNTGGGEAGPAFQAVPSTT